MSLSGRSPKEQYSTLKLLAEIAQGLKMLNDDPKILNKLIVEANTLGADEEKRSLEAREQIAIYHDLVAKNNSLVAQKNLAQQKLDEGNADLSKKNEALQAAQTELNKRLYAADVQEKKLAEQDKDLSQREMSLENSVKQLQEAQQSFKKEKKDFEDYQNSLKAKAEQLRGIAEGL